MAARGLGMRRPAGVSFIGSRKKRDEQACGSPRKSRAVERQSQRRSCSFCSQALMCRVGRRTKGRGAGKGSA
jgi:hypothetical protein